MLTGPSGNGISTTPEGRREWTRLLLSPLCSYHDARSGKQDDLLVSCPELPLFAPAEASPRSEAPALPVGTVWKDFVTPFFRPLLSPARPLGSPGAGRASKAFGEVQEEQKVGGGSFSSPGFAGAGGDLVQKHPLTLHSRETGIQVLSWMRDVNPLVSSVTLQI